MATTLTQLLPPDTLFGLHTDRPGPLRAEDFEAIEQDPSNPMELIEGWALPMSPTAFVGGQLWGELYRVLYPLVEERGWQMSLDALHRLPHPPDTVLYPDLVIHCVSRVEYLPGRQTVGRAPDLVIELLSEATAERDRGPRGAKFRAFEMSGVAEYYYVWPDGREASGFRLEQGRYVPLERDADGFFPSPLLGKRLRLVPPALA